MRDENLPTTDRAITRRDPDRAPREVAYDGRHTEQRALVRHSRDERSRHGDGQYAQLSGSPATHERRPYTEEGYGQLTHRPVRSERAGESTRTYGSRDFVDPPGPKVTPEEIKESLVTLYTNIKKASNFLSGFKQEYEQDILRVKTYAESEDLAYLWVDKVNFSNEIGPPAQRQIAQGKAINGQVPRFRDISSQLTASLSVATTNSSSVLSDQYMAVAKKLSGVNNEMKQLLRRASNSVSGVDSLLTELEMLAILLERNGAGKASTNGNAAGEGGGRDQRQQSVDSGYGGSVGGQAGYSQQFDQGDDNGPGDQSGHESEQAAGSGGGDE